jgi:hypothetical protein
MLLLNCSSVLVNTKSHGHEAQLQSSLRDGIISEGGHTMFQWEYISWVSWADGTENYMAYFISMKVHTDELYLSLFCWRFSFSFSDKMAKCMGRTLFPSITSIALPQTNKIEMMSKQLHFYFSNEDMENSDMK